MKISARSIVLGGLIGALYVALTLALQPFGYGPVQFRLAECLTVLPAIFPGAIPGLFVGCFLANYLGGFGLADMVFGSLATLLAGLATYSLRNYKLLLPLPPVLFNGLIVGAYVYLLYDKTYPMALTMLFIAFSQLIICYGLGLPLLSLIKRNKVLSSYAVPQTKR